MQNKKIKIVFIYQVIMHYRLPFYERISKDEQFDFCLLYGRGKPGTKLVNTNSPIKFRAKQVFDFRIPLKTSGRQSYIPFSPFLLYHLIVESPKVVFSEGSSSIINSSVAFLYAKIFRKKFVWWSLGMLEGREYTGFRKYLSAWEKVIEKNSDAIFTYSSRGRDYFLTRGVKDENIFVAVNVIDTEKKLKEIESYSSHRNSVLDLGRFNIVFIGSITEEKNLILLVNCLERFNIKYNGAAKLHIVGDGSYVTFLKDYITEKCLNENVIFYGRINEGASVILSKCDVMILPGLGGLAIAEAMLNRLPVITGKADGTEYDLVSDNGFLLEDMNEDNLLDKIEFLYHNEEIRKQMGNLSFDKITQDFSIQNYYLKFQQTINHILK